MQRRTFIKTLGAGAAVVSAPSFALTKKHWTPTTAAELLAAINVVLPVGEPTEISRAVTGEEYVEYALATPAVKEPEKRLVSVAWKNFFTQYVDTPPGARIYWRLEPEISQWRSEWTDERGMMKIYMRYLISALPARFTQEELLQLGSRMFGPTSNAAFNATYVGV